MSKYTLRKYLFDKRVELYEEVNLLKDKVMADDFNEEDMTKLEVAESELNLIKEVIEICIQRNKF